MDGGGDVPFRYISVYYGVFTCLLLKEQECHDFPSRIWKYNTISCLRHVSKTFCKGVFIIYMRGAGKLELARGNFNTPPLFATKITNPHIFHRQKLLPNLFFFSSFFGGRGGN